MAATNIDWADRVWNPVVGCSIASAGCTNCYAMRMAKRLEAMGKKDYAGLTKTVNGRAVWTGEVRCLWRRLGDPLHWRKPCRFFVNSMSDLFHTAVPFEFIAAVHAVIDAASTDGHQAIILTKRPERAVEFYRWLSHESERCTTLGPRWSKEGSFCARIAHARDTGHMHRLYMASGQWPIPNLILGVSVEDQATADQRIPHLVQCQAATRIVSAEPLLGPVDIVTPAMNATRGQAGMSMRRLIQGAIVGGESGPGARPCDTDWIRWMVEQTRAVRVACYVKQLGAVAVNAGGRCSHLTATAMTKSGRIDAAVQDDGNGTAVFPRLQLRDRAGADPAEWPEDLRVRQWVGQEVRK